MNVFKNVRLFTVLALMLGVLILGGCSGSQKSGGETAGDQASTSAKPIKVGIIDTYTGPATTYTKDALNGFELALEEVNKKGVLGAKIEFVTRDDEFKPDKAKQWAKELVMRDNVDLLVGSINSAAALAVSEYAKETKIPFLVWGAMTEKITGAAGHRYAFSMLPNTDVIGIAGATQMAGMPYTKYWLAGSDYEYGHSVVNSFWTKLQEKKPGVNKVGESWWPVGEPDFTPYINAIKAAKPEVLVVGTGGADMVPFMKAIKATGLNKEVKVWIHTATDLGTLLPIGDAAPEGIYGTSPYHHYFPETPENKSFVEAFKAKFNREPASFALSGYLTGKFIAEAFAKAGAVDREKFIDAMEGLKVDSPVGEVQMRGFDHQIIRPMYFGVTKKTDKPYLVSSEISTLAGEDIIPTEEEIKAKRK